MVRDRLKELVDFAKTESPYKSANKGWINQDVYLSLGDSSSGQLTDTPDFVRIDLFWQPLKKLLSYLFVTFFAASIFVFTAISFDHGTFNLSFIGNFGNQPQRLTEEHHEQDDVLENSAQLLTDEVSQNDELLVTSSLIDQTSENKELDSPINEKPSVNKDLESSMMSTQKRKSNFF